VGWVDGRPGRGRQSRAIGKKGAGGMAQLDGGQKWRVGDQGCVDQDSGCHGLHLAVMGRTWSSYGCYGLHLQGTGQGVVPASQARLARKQECLCVCQGSHTTQAAVRSLASKVSGTQLAVQSSWRTADHSTCIN
jgi:hypothetical protein